MPAELRNVIVVGAGLGGTNAVEALERVLPPTHRIVVVTEKEYAYFPLAALRAATVPGWEAKCLGDVTTLFSKASRHIVLPGTKVLELADHHVKVDRVHAGFRDVIQFDQLVYATGMIYSFPFRACDRSNTSSELQSLLRMFQDAIKAAQKILIVGGGASGIEFAGEIAAQYQGAKAITLAHSGELPLTSTGWKKKVGQCIQAQLLEMCVQTVSNCRVDTRGIPTGPIERQRFDLGSGRRVEADFLINAFGITPRSSLMEVFNPEVLDPAGFVKVKPTLQVATSDASLDHIFAVGDVNNADPTKQAVWADAHGPVVAANVAALAKGQRPTRKYKSGTRLGVFSLGPKGERGRSTLAGSLVAG